MAEIKRKLSKPMRKINLLYKIIMALLAGISLTLATLTDTHEIYYQIVSVFSSAFPIVWSQILDGCKEYENEQTPEILSPARNTPPLDPEDTDENNIKNNN